MKKNTQPRQILVNLRNIHKARGLSINNLAEKISDTSTHWDVS